VPEVGLQQTSVTPIGPAVVPIRTADASAGYSTAYGLGIHQL
jgi:hypothetical protein